MLVFGTSWRLRRSLPKKPRSSSPSQPTTPRVSESPTLSSRRSSQRQHGLHTSGGDPCFDDNFKKSDSTSSAFRRRATNGAQQMGMDTSSSAARTTTTTLDVSYGSTWRSPTPTTRTAHSTSSPDTATFSSVSQGSSSSKSLRTASIPPFVYFMLLTARKVLKNDKTFGSDYRSSYNSTDPTSCSPTPTADLEACSRHLLDLLDFPRPRTATARNFTR